MTITYDTALLKVMVLFENMTQTKLKDCFQDVTQNSMTFVVQPGESGRAIGKNGVIVRHIEQLLNKHVRVVEFSAEKNTFIRNLVQPLHIEQIEEDEEGIVTLTGKDSKTKGLLIGRNGQNLRALEEKVRRHFPVKEIRVV